MKSFEYAINSKHNKASLYLYDEPWWLALCVWFTEHLLVRVYDIQIPLPNWRKQPRDLPYTTDLYGWRDWYGTVGDVLFCFVFVPAQQWCYMKRQPYEYHFELPYTVLAEQLKEHDPDFFTREACLVDAAQEHEED